MDHVLGNVARETLQMEVEVVGAGLSDHFTQTIALNFKKSPAKKPAPGCNALGVPGISIKWIKKLSSSCYKNLIYDQLGKSGIQNSPRLSLCTDCIYVQICKSKTMEGLYGQDEVSNVVCLMRT